LNFLKGTHDVFEREIQFFIDAYNDLGAKINKFIQYVNKDWK